MAGSKETSVSKIDGIRHSLAHLLVAAVRELYPGAQNAIGPAIENGFYQDFDMPKPISETDLPKIEEKMRELLPRWTQWTSTTVTLPQVKKEFAWNKYKMELAREFAKEGKKLTFYTCGGFVDLCKGGHTLPLTNIDPHSFKLDRVAGAYWRGSEKNPQLQRIYGLAFGTKKELEEYLKMREEAEKRDHRKIGEQLELFKIDERVGRGLILWLPHGNIIKEELEQWAKNTEEEWGYQRVTTPHITKSELFYTSGHLPYYKSDMYPAMKFDDGEEYYLRPMNCPHHHMIYSSRPRSYRELPLRLAEYGAVYRYEASGELFGLMRVRGMIQNDAHIYCTQEQAVEEFVNVMKLHEYYYKSLGITDYYLELALRDHANTEKYHGDAKMWKLAEDLMRKAVAKTNIRMVEQVGSAAFYGPKIDFVIKSSIGREFSISTNQIDLFMGQRFGLTYVDSGGVEKIPVIIHRAPLGSHERFVGFLIEHFAGAFPLWLSPVQAEVITVGSAQKKYAEKIYAELKEAGVRTNLSDENLTVGKRIREAELKKIPYILVVGEKEEANGAVNVRHYRRGQEGELKLERLLEKILGEIKNKTI